MQILITGVAGFIGYHLAQRLLNEGEQVYGVDNLNDYYEVDLKQARLAQLKTEPGFTFQYLDLSRHQDVLELFEHDFDCVVNLAAQAGVRYSLINPIACVNSNIAGFINVLEGCRYGDVKHLVFASSSSVYGNNAKVPFSTADTVDRPISLYAATKKANELMAHTYSHLYQLPTTGLRFFTVYGPWGRPDMAYFKFAKAIDRGQPIDVYNFGKMRRDFTYIDDIVEGIVRAIHRPPQSSTQKVDRSETELSEAPYKIYNLGNNQPVELMTFIQVIENAMGKLAKINLLPMQPGDVAVTYADLQDTIDDLAFMPATSVEVGVEKFVAWYRSYYGSSSL